MPMEETPKSPPQAIDSSAPAPEPVPAPEAASPPDPAVAAKTVTSPSVAASQRVPGTTDPSTAGLQADPRPGSPPGPSDDDEALYTRAHRLHFVDRDPGAALAAWDAYLRAYPRGRLAPESRYNRALCLVRLGRRDEARAALAGFAKGTYGGYRQAEARSLLEAMESAPP
jgi:TolA-binding protein